MKKNIVLCLLLFWVVPSFAQEKAIGYALEALQKAFNENDYDLLRPHVASELTIAGKKGDQLHNFMPEILKIYTKKIEAVKIDQINQEGENFRVSATFSLEDKKDKIYTFLFDAEFRFLEINMFKIAQKDPDPAENTLPNTPNLSNVTVTLMAGVLVVEGDIDGTKGDFLIDFNYSKSVLNPKRIDTKKLSSPQAKTYQAKYLKINRIVEKETVFELKDLGTKERDTGLKILGIIGMDILEKFEVSIDAQAGTLTFALLDQGGEPLEAKFTKTPDYQVSMTVKPNLIPCKFTFGKNEYNVAINFSSSTSYFNNSVETLEKGKAKPVSQDNLFCHDGKLHLLPQYEYKKGFLGTIEIKNYMAGFMANNFFPVIDEVEMQGIIGIDMLENVVVSYNFITGIVSIRDRNKL